MKLLSRKTWLASGLGLAVAMAGCQTYHPQTGLTLPSPRYLEHYPQYIPPSPSFPHTRELTTLQEAAAKEMPAPPGPLGP